jgi:hypothetical protein
MGRDTIPQLNNNIYFDPRIIVLKIQMDMSTRTNAIAQNNRVYRRTIVTNP